MKTSSIWKRAVSISAVVVVLFIAVALLAQPVDDPPLNVLKMGLGSGTVTSGDGLINCGTGGTDCDEGYAPTASVTLTATAASGSTFAGWDVDLDGDSGTSPDCTANPCTLTMNVPRSVRAVFNLNTPIPALTTFTPEAIQTYLTANPTVNSTAKFIKALPDEFKQNWILMTRSESLQTGTAEFPRILLPNGNSQAVFTIALSTHNSYPGAHPDAIEYMQWDPAQKNFRFHEIVLNAIGPMDPDGDGIGVIAARPRKVYPDDAKCPRCHSTRNILNLNRTVSPPVPGTAVGTDGLTPGTILSKNKPNWDSYDSWGGMMPFNRDRIYQGSVEAATFRKFFDPWTWRTNEPVRSVIEQLKLQPASVPASHVITRLKGGSNDGIIKFAFDTSVPVLDEPAPSGPSSTSIGYSFEGVFSAPTPVAPTPVVQGGTSFVTLHHSNIPGSDEGRGVRFFDALGGLAGTLPGHTPVNQTRIADELTGNIPYFATGSVPIDIRPIALAITKSVPGGGGCLQRDAATNRVISLTMTPLVDLSFFDSRNGLTINEVFNDTERRALTPPPPPPLMPEARSRILPRRKADIQKLNFDRTGDVYLVAPEDGLIQEYGARTSAGTSVTVDRLRQEVFRRPITGFSGDSTVMGGIYVDREFYSNTEQVALYRYFLEPLGVSVDKWSMNVRGRSRAYNFADVFDSYLDVFEPTLRTSLTTTPFPMLTNPNDCDQLINAVNRSFLALPAADGAGGIPTYTDIQRIFNKSCIECHGGLDYPPYQNYGQILDLTEDENPPPMRDRLDRSYDLVTSAFVSSPPNLATSQLYQRITRTNERCPGGLMPCGGPPLSKTDIETIRRWIVGPPEPSRTRGDPHIETVDGVPYDFQSAGEFVLLRGQGLEIQVRQTAIGTDGPLGPNEHTGLTSCVSVNSAAAVRAGNHRITFQPNTNGRADSSGMQLRIDGELARLTSEGIVLDSGGRVVQTSAPGGIQIEAQGGTVIVMTPRFWDYYQVWLLDIDVHHARARDGVMGAMARGSWLPALPDGSSLGPRPETDFHQRYVDLYEKFENAWRVTAETSLFDYAEGTSTSSFTFADWPAENPKVCAAPPRPPSGPLEKSPPKALALEVAQKHCADLAGARAKINCVQDVMVTGEPGFAELYLMGEKVERNAVPDPPVLGSPADWTDLTGPVDFTWNQTADKENDPLTYRHCVWPVKERFNFHKCVALPVGTTSSWLGGWRGGWRGGILCAVLVLLIGLLLLAILLWLGLKKKQPVLLYLLLIVILAGVVLAFFIGRNRSISSSSTLAKSMPGLESGKAYYWKVIAEDGKGGTAESETRRFEMK